MYIVKLVQTGNSQTLSVPSLMRRQMNIVRSDFFVVQAKNKNILQYTRLTPSSIRDVKKQMLKEKKRNVAGK